MPLRDYFERDIKTMMNTGVFATKHLVNGVEMDIIVDNDLLKERQRKSQDPDGLYEGDLLIMVRATEYAKCGGSRPVPGEVINIDGTNYRVTDCPEDEGLYTITLEAYQS